MWKEGRKKKSLLKNALFLARSPSYGDQRAYWADYLSSTNQVIPGGLVKGYIPRKVETTIG